MATIVVAALAVGAAAHAQSLRHDTNLPIEITADSLEVMQDQRIATFRGNVDAVQGDMVLSAELLNYALPGLQEKAARLKRELDDIQRLKDDADRQRGEIAVATLGQPRGICSRRRRHSKAACSTNPISRPGGLNL